MIDNVTIEDLFDDQRITFPCGHEGTIITPADLEFKAPPAGSLAYGRLVLVIAKPKNKIQVDIDLKAHAVNIKSVPLTNEQDAGDQSLLIRIPVGIRIFKVNSAAGSFFYYETSQGYNIMPICIAAGTYDGQKTQELVLIVSPVPPRDPNLATAKFMPKELTAEQLKTRITQTGKDDEV